MFDLFLKAVPKNYGKFQEQEIFVLASPSYQRFANVLSDVKQKYKRSYC